MRIALFILYIMARLNVSIPDDIYELASKWRGVVNLSEVCARALREELEAAEASRTATRFMQNVRVHTDSERRLIERFQLVDAVVTPTPAHEGLLREALGASAAVYLDRTLTDGVVLGVGGGRQMWCVVRSATPRPVRVTLTALGVHQNDPSVLHAHPNTLVTLLWLLYAPKCTAPLVGADTFDALWSPPEQDSVDLQRCLIASCAPWNPDSAFGRLLGENASAFLSSEQTCGDFAYQFLRSDGSRVGYSPPAHSSLLEGGKLHALSGRNDSRVVVAAGGSSKLPVLRLTLSARLCNVLITNEASAHALSSQPAAEE